MLKVNINMLCRVVAGLFVAFFVYIFNENYCYKNCTCIMTTNSCTSTVDLPCGKARL